VALNPQYPESHRQLALNLHALERYDEAIPFLKKVLALKPHDPTAGHLLNALEKRPVQSAPAGYVGRLFNRFAATFVIV
jgi:tetratricopeptide (TPR) repeat protein